MFYLILSNDVRFNGLGVSWGWCSRDNRSHLRIYPWIVRTVLDPMRILNANHSLNDPRNSQGNDSRRTGRKGAGASIARLTRGEVILDVAREATGRLPEKSKTMKAWAERLHQVLICCELLLIEIHNLVFEFLQGASSGTLHTKPTLHVLSRP